MSATQKFMFDRSFDPPEAAAAVKPTEEEEEIQEEVVAEPEEVYPTFSEAELEATRQDAFEKGKEEGIREASEATESLIRDTTRAIGIQLSEQYSHQKTVNADILEDAINIAVAIVRKCFPHMQTEHQIKEIEHMVAEILSQILEEPRVVITVNPDISTPLGERMETIKTESHFEGRVVIREDASINPGDCRVEWSSGGAERNSDELWRQINDIVESNLGAESRIAEPENLPHNDLTPQTPEEQPEPQSAEALPETPVETPADTPADALVNTPGESVTGNMDTDADKTAEIQPEQPASSQVASGVESNTNSSLEAPEGAPPTPFVNEDETSEISQSSGDSGEINAPAEEMPEASDPTGQADMGEVAGPAPHPPTLDEDEAGMEHEAEAGILETVQDTETTQTSDQPA